MDESVAYAAAVAARAAGDTFEDIVAMVGHAVRAETLADLHSALVVDLVARAAWQHDRSRPDDDTSRLEWAAMNPIRKAQEETYVRELVGILTANVPPFRRRVRAANESPAGDHA